ncbi:MAG: acyltransferase domain-containing protein [Acidobacteriota bacterium]
MGAIVIDGPAQMNAVRQPGTVFMFSGQGSQYFHMGRALYDANGTFRDWMNRLDDVVRQTSGQSVLAALYSEGKSKGDSFDRTSLTHPAIFMVEVALARALMQAGVTPSLVLGVSMGSFAAAAVSGFLDVEDALRAVVHQALALEEWAEPGGMTAVLADPALFAKSFLSARSELAAVNFASHFVVTARQTELAGIGADLRRYEVNHQQLPVTFPFHSQWIDGARAPFQTFMRSIGTRPGHVPMVCSDQGTVVSQLSESYFWDVVRKPIRFRETIAGLERQGPWRYIDVGPAGTLATFLKYGLPSGTASTVSAILTPFGTDLKNLATVSAGH